MPPAPRRAVRPAPRCWFAATCPHRHRSSSAPTSWTPSPTTCPPVWSISASRSTMRGRCRSTERRSRPAGRSVRPPRTTSPRRVSVRCATRRRRCGGWPWSRRRLLWLAAIVIAARVRVSVGRRDSLLLADETLIDLTDDAGPVLVDPGLAHDPGSRTGDRGRAGRAPDDARRHARGAVVNRRATTCTGRAAGRLRGADRRRARRADHRRPVLRHAGRRLDAGGQRRSVAHGELVLPGRSRHRRRRCRRRRRRRQPVRRAARRAGSRSSPPMAWARASRSSSSPGLGRRSTSTRS